VTEQEALVRAIVTEPEDDTVRLVYADWLQDHEQEAWAEFIRLQIALTRGRDWLTVNGAGFHWCPRCLYSPDPRSTWQKTYGPENRVNTCRECGVLLRRQHQSWPAIREGVFRPTLPALTPTEWCVHADHVGGIAAVGKTVVVRRGFVHELRYDTHALLGGSCRTCNGCGHHHRDDSLTPAQVRKAYPVLICKTCNGKRRFPGLAAGLFKTNPITRVMLTNQEPYRGGVDSHHWYDGRTDENDGIHPESDLPDVVYDALTGGRRTGRFLDYPTEQAAFDALSAALVKVCRKRAGLGRPR
jgi:uncharacterized protein (TIGR02996 family)